MAQLDQSQLPRRPDLARPRGRGQGPGGAEAPETCPRLSTQGPSLEALTGVASALVPCAVSPRALESDSNSEVTL